LDVGADFPERRALAGIQAPGAVISALGVNLRTNRAHQISYALALEDCDKVDAGESGEDFGPIELAFDTATPVVPTRIAAVSANAQSPSWRVYGVSASASQLAITSGSAYPAMTTYSDELGATTLSSAPQLSKLASAGDRLVRLEVGFAFSGIQKDMFLTASAPAK
jgi:hypothetical protein